MRLNSKLHCIPQGCGYAFISRGSGSSSFSECRSGFGSRSRSRSSLAKFEEKKSWRVFLSCKKHESLLKSKKQWSLCKFTLKKLNKVVVISNFLAFFQFLLTNLPSWIRIHMDLHSFSFLDPDPQPWYTSVYSANSSSPAYLLANYSIQCATTAADRRVNCKLQCIPVHV